MPQSEWRLLCWVALVCYIPFPGRVVVRDGMPIMTTYRASLLDSLIAFRVGKTTVTDVLPSVSTIHLLHTGAEALD